MEVDFNIVVSIPKTQNIGKGNKCVTHYLLVVEATSSTTQEVWQWMKARRYSEFHGLYQEMKKKFPEQLKKVNFPPKKMFNRMSSAVIAERRVMLEEFLGVVVEDLNIINTDTHLRAFLEIDKTLTPIILREREHEASLRERERGLLPSEQEIEESVQQYARALFSFEPTAEDEISLTSGEYVIIHSVREDGWCEGQIHGEIGFFPESYVEMVDELPENPNDVIGEQIQNQPPPLPKPRVPSTLKDEVKQKRRKDLMQRLRQMTSKRKLSNSGTVTAPGVPYVTGTALFKFQGKSDLELSFLRGDSVVVYNIDQESGWWQGQVRDTIGYFPGSYISLPDGSEENLISMLEQHEEKPTDRPSTPHSQAPVPRTTRPPPQKPTGRPLPTAPSRQEHPIRVRGNSLSPAQSQELSASNPILQKIVAASSTDYVRKCIMCPCDHWCPSMHEKNICENCRHLYRMHRTLSKMG